MLVLFIWQFMLVLLCRAAPADLSSPTTATRAAPQPTICGDIVNSCNDTFTAKQAYDCLTSVPFNAAVASRFIKYVNDTIQFQSTLAYLKNPPASYQQPAVDIAGGLQRIQQDIDRGAFRNQYTFEATLQSLIFAAHDAHLQLNAGILAAFSWFSPYALVSLSEDGIREPKVYVVDDVYLSQKKGTSFKPSAVKTINGQNVTEFLIHIGAENSFGNLEPHTDWNNLMSSWAAYIQNDYSTLENYIQFYPGENITLAFENGTESVPTPWLANYVNPGPTGPLATGGDFYNFFVLGFYPASYDSNAPDQCPSRYGISNTTRSLNISLANLPTATSWPNSAYPESADIYQPKLYPNGNGFVTGYFLRDISTAVLSIPTFYMSNNDTATFSTTVANFLRASHEAGMQKILIDLQQNSGGDTFLAVDTFKKIFPTNDTFRGTRFRAQPTADVLGTTLTGYFQTGNFNSTLRDALVRNVWVASDRLDAATDQNFTSWAEAFGPHEFNGDLFSTVERDNISSAIIDSQSGGSQTDGASNGNVLPQYYNPDNIAILTDGLCASACTVFVEMMHYGAGVRTVVAGGLPYSGPMQAAGGTRGYQVYESIDIDYDIEAVSYLNQTAKSILPDRRVQTLITSFRVNLRDQIRQNENTPVQFLYDAADCRIYYTADSWSNYTTLWTYAATAIFNNTTLCVPGSTGHATPAGGSRTSGPPPGNYNPAQSDSTYSYNPDKFIDDAAGNSIGEGYYIAEEVGPNAGNSGPIYCDNQGNPCPVGDCVFTEEHGYAEYNGRTILWESGECPQNSNPSYEAGTFDMITDSDQPAEIHDDVVGRKGGGDSHGAGLARTIMAGFTRRFARWRRR